MSSATPPDLILRPAVADDAGEVAAVHLQARASAEMPPGVHPPNEVLAFLGERLEVDEVWVAVTSSGGRERVVGYLRMTPTWVDDLYVLPECARSGIGSALLDVAKARRPHGFGLWVFEMNRPARDFYARQGLWEVRRTDGADNEEHMPDIELAWRPR